MLYLYSLCSVKHKIVLGQESQQESTAARKDIPIRPQPEGFAIECVGDRLGYLEILRVNHFDVARAERALALCGL